MKFRLTHSSFYFSFQEGCLIHIAHSKRASWLIFLNPWSVYAKSAAYGALGYEVQSRYYSRFILFLFLKKRLAKYLGRTQPELVCELLGPPSPHNFLRTAFDLVSGATPNTLPTPLFAKTNSLLQALWKNREAHSAYDRVASINLLMSATGGENVQWVPDQIIKLGFAKSLPNYGWKGQGELVTILLTSFNAGLLVRQSIESLLNQSHRNLQILVANDASTDDT